MDLVDLGVIAIIFFAVGLLVWLIFGWMDW
jgi:hypothetical protein